MDKKLPKLEDKGAALTPAGVRLGYVDGPEGQSCGSSNDWSISAPTGASRHRRGRRTEIFDEIRTFDYYLSTPSWRSVSCCSDPLPGPFRRWRR